MVYRDIDYSHYYRKWHPDTSEHINGMALMYERNLSIFLPKAKDISILDVGCGMGTAMRCFNMMGYGKIQGIDISKEQVEFCQSKGLDVVLVSDSVSYLQNFQNRFDLVIAFDVIEHIPVQDQIRFISAIWQSLNYGGIFLCTVPNANSTLAARWRYNDWTHFSSFTEHSLEFILYSAGFREITILPFEFIHRPKHQYVPSLTTFYWWLFRLVRLFRRIEIISELGNDGIHAPLSLNILARGIK